MISVVIPVLNGARTIGHQLRALADQRVDFPWEVVVADNGSTDGTRAVAESFRGAVPDIRIVDASSRRGPAAARNIGAAAAAGEVLAFCDADDIVGQGWLAAIAAAAAHHDFVAGGIDFYGIDGPFAAGELPPSWTPREGTFGWLKYALGANMAVSRRAFTRVGGFAEELHAGEDLDLSWRLQLAGYPLHCEPDAVVQKRSRPGTRQRMRQHIDYGRHDAVLYKRLRRSGMPRRPLKVQVRVHGWLVVNVWRLAAGGPGRETWLLGASTVIGRLIGSVRHRVLYL